MVALAVAGSAATGAPPTSSCGSDAPSYTSRHAAALSRARVSADGAVLPDRRRRVRARSRRWRDYPDILDRRPFRRRLAPGIRRSSELRAGCRRLAAGWRRAADQTTSTDATIDHSDRRRRRPTCQSTAIRQRRGRGESIAGLVPPAVQQHIEQHGLYAHRLDAGGGAGRRAADVRRRQAGCMAKTEKRGRPTRAPAQVERAVRAAEDKKAVDIWSCSTCARPPGSPTSS